jgi:endonuclease-3 related protein
MAIQLPNYQIAQSPDSTAPPRLLGEIPQYYTALLARYGPQNWWPARSRFEVIVGAYLTQNTNWSNVEKALLNLRRARRLSVKGMREAPRDELETLVRPSGYFRQKARNLKTFIAFLDRQYSSSLSRMFAQPTAKLRTELLELNGVGPETADSILLYAGNHPVFVVDAYTRRVLLRHGVIGAGAKKIKGKKIKGKKIKGKKIKVKKIKPGYEEIRSIIELAISSSEVESLVVQNADPDPRHPVSRMSSSARSELAQHYNELHALIVRVGNHYCRTKPICEGCPLQSFLKTRESATARGTSAF